MSRRLRYQVAVSLDGFIAGPNGEADWIVMDPSIDFNAMFKEFDTVVMERNAGLVDTVELAVMPVLLGSGVPLLPPGGTTKLVLADQKTLPTSGIVVLSHSVPGGTGPTPRIGYISTPRPRSKKKSSHVGKSAAGVKPQTVAIRAAPDA